MKPENSIYEIRIQMFRHGGDFVRKLAACLGAADLENQAKICEAFPEIIARYDSLATLENRQQPELGENETSPSADVNMKS